MVKTTSPSPGGSANLKDVVDVLKTTNLLIATQGSALNDFIKSQEKAKALASKDALESGREGRAGGGRMMGAGRAILRGGAEMTGLPALGRGLGMLLAPITAGIGFILKPLKFLSKLLIKGGPIGLLITGMYLFFKDIAENPTFNKVIENLKTTWNDSIVPTFTSIKESVDALINNESVKDTFESISNWFSNFKTQIQDWVLGNLDIITTTIADVLKGVDDLLKGDWKAGISKIGSSLFNGIKDFFDNTMTQILELFGVDFGEGGSFLTSAEGIINTLLINMLSKFNDFKQGIKDSFTSMINFFVGENGYVMTTITSMQLSITNKWNSFKETVVSTWQTMVEDVKTAFTDAVDTIILKNVAKIVGLKDGMIEKWGEIKDSLMASIGAVALWFQFKPKELGLLLEEKWVETKGAFLEKLASFAGTIQAIPSQLKLALLENLKETPLLGGLVTDNMLANARANADSGKDFAEMLIADQRSKTQEELKRIQRDRIALGMEKIRAERAMTTVVQQNTGGTTVNTTNLNPNSGSVADPYANSYMGQAIPGAF